MTKEATSELINLLEICLEQNNLTFIGQINTGKQQPTNGGQHYQD